MLSYLEKYGQLPLSVRQKFASPKAASQLKALEGAYGVKLSVFVIKLLVEEIAVADGVAVLIKDFNLSQTNAENLMAEIKNKILIFKDEQPAPTSPTAPDLGEPTAEDADLAKKIADVMAEVKIDFASQALAERFKKIILTYLKGIRNRISAKEALSKPVENGGLGFDVNSAESILRLIKNEQAAGPIKRPASWLSPLSEKMPIARDDGYDLAKSLKDRAANTPVKTEAPVEAEAEVEEEKLLAPLTPAPLSIESVLAPTPTPTPTPTSPLPEKIITATPATPTAPAVKEKSQPVAVKIAEVKPPVDNLRRTEAGKVKMDDILTPPRVFSPVDEIKYMTVKNFRHLSPDPVQAVAIIKSKIEGLAKEDFSKKVAGVQGWKISPINRMYVETYQEAINSGKGITAVLNKNKKINPEFITEAEFEAILTLNQELKSLLSD